MLYFIVDIVVTVGLEHDPFIFQLHSANRIMWAYIPQMSKLITPFES